MHTDILLPNDLFSNDVKTKEGDTGTGILDVFDRYNFTVKEDEPLEKEVAVDPEMLGKVFENLLEVKDRKSKGTYYTPREIVHYMCQESLINYLVTEVGANGISPARVGAWRAMPLREDIEKLIKYGETAVEHDRRVVTKGRETDAYSFKLPESIRDYAALIDEKLKNIRVCDPAIGSGAFPVGMMHEIVKVRNALTTYLLASENGSRKSPPLEKGGEGGFLNERTPYNFKRHAIHDCLYGVDIDPGAVEIAKLRLWLSLLVDEEDIKHIKPLPNLDYKIMQGNSLLEEFEGIRLFDEKLISSKPFDEEQIKEIKAQQSRLQKEFINLHNSGKLTKVKRGQIETEQAKLSALLKQLMNPDKTSPQESITYEVSAGEVAKKLKRLHEAYFDTYLKSRKDELRREIDELEWELIEITLKEQKQGDALARLSDIRRANIKPFFLWKLNFNEVFQEKDGFDIVIANPPYVRQEAIKDIKPFLSKEFGNFYCGTADIYTYFYKRGIDVLKPSGHLCFIAPNKFMRAGYGKNTRELLTRDVTPVTVIDFCDLPIFDATTYPAVVLVKKPLNNPDVGQPLQDEFLAATFNNAEQLNNLENSLSEIGFSMPICSLKSEGWNLEQPEVLALMEKLRKAGTPLGEYVKGMFYRGIVTGFNEAFVIDERKRKELLASDPKSVNVIKPYLQGRHINKWKASENGQYLLYIPWHFKIEDYPAIYDHIKQYKDQLERRSPTEVGRYEWYALQRYASDYFLEFEKPKIVWGNLAIEPKFAFDSSSNYVSAPANIIPTTDLSLLAVLNSPLCKWWISLQAAVRLGGFLEYKPMYVGTVPIAQISDKQKVPIIERVNKILALMQNPPSPPFSKGGDNEDIPRLEKEIDRLVYKLYGLTPEEIAIVEGKG